MKSATLAARKRNLEFKSCKLEDFSITVIELDGQIESAECLTPIVEIATSAETKHVVILMQNVEYMNSKALGGLIAMHRQVENRGFRMYTVNPVGGIAKVMERLGCHKLLRIRDSIEKAIQEVKQITV